MQPHFGLRIWGEKRPAKNPSSRRPPRARPRLEDLESRLAPAALLTYDAVSGVLSLTQDNAAPLTVIISEPVPDRLEFNLLGPGPAGKFSDSSTQLLGLDYNDPGSPDTSDSAALDLSLLTISRLEISLPDTSLEFGDIANLSGHVQEIKVTDSSFVTFTGAVDTNAVLAPGTGRVEINATNSIVLTPGSAITTGNGDVILRANVSMLATPGLGGSNGIVVSGATIETSGSGNITLEGVGAANTPGDHGLIGVAIDKGGSVRTLSTGQVSITGTAGEGAYDNIGVRIADTSLNNLPTGVTTASGNVSILSKSVNPGMGNTGILVGAAGVVSAAGAGTVTLRDTGGQGITVTGTVQTERGTLKLLALEGASLSAGNYTGVTVDGGTVETTGNGSIELRGKGGINPSATVPLSGVAVINGGVVQTAGGGAVTLDGTGGFGAGPDYGVNISGSLVSAAGGVVSITGTGGFFGPGNDGVNLNNLRGGTPGKVIGGIINVTGTNGAGANVAINLAAGELNATNRITLTGDSMSLTAGSAVTASNGVIIKQKTIGVRIALGYGVPGLNLGLVLSNDLIRGIFTATLSIGDASTGSIILGSVINPAPGFTTLSLRSNGSVTQAAGATQIKVNTLAIQAAVAVGTATAPLGTVAANLAISAGNGGVFVNNTGNLTLTSTQGVSGVTATGGNIVVNTTGRLNVSAGVRNTGTGSIALRTLDAATVGQDLNVAAGVTIQANGGNIALQAGDNLTVDAAAILITARMGTINLFTDYGSHDVGTGGVATVLGTLQAFRTTITGNVDADRFLTMPSVLTPITVVGGGNLGDRLSVRLRTPVAKVTGGAPTFGSLGFGPAYKAIAYTGIGAAVTILPALPAAATVSAAAQAGTKTQGGTGSTGGTTTGTGDRRNL